MWFTVKWTIFLLILPLIASDDTFYAQDSDPQQIHLSLGRSADEIVVTWSTFLASDTSYVEYGQDSENLRSLAKGWRTKFVDDGSLKRTQYIHRVFLSNLKPFTRYYYRCGSKKIWSKLFSFRTISNGTNWSPRMLLYGDLGLVNGVSIPFIQKEVDEGNADLIFHNGDFAYDMADQEGTIGDRFMNKMQPITSKIIYQTSVGNHEEAYNFSHYVNRFSMYDQTSVSGRKGDFYYAFYLGPAFIIVLNTEVYQWHFTKADQDAQKDWLEYVLQIANQPENRARHPWIIVFAHKPLYCTNNSTHDNDCTSWAKWFRSEFEDQMYKYGVDVAIWAHEHTYERTYPVYQSVLRGNASDNPYTDPKATVHIITGNAGNHEQLDNFGDKEPWSAFRLAEYGYAMIHFLNGTHLVFEHKNSAGLLAGQVVDSITIIQNKHGSFVTPEDALPSNPNVPEQIHLSLGRSHSQMAITWTTYAPTSLTQVRYGLWADSLFQTEYGFTTEFVDNGNRTHFIHRVMLINLKPNSTYYYQVAGNSAWSHLASFRTLSDEPDVSRRMLVYGDLGFVNPVTVPYMSQEVHNGTVDLIFHNGDFAYDLHDDYSTIGDLFMRLMEPLVTRVPYQTSIGNHETFCSAALENYIHRFSMYDMTTLMAGKSDHFYGFYFGAALIISINNEVFLNYTDLPSTLKAEQGAWLVSLLKVANKPENRARHPWIIILGHQPMYCHTCVDEESCKADARTMQANLEEIIYTYGVDLAIWSHMHNYERQFPMYRDKLVVTDFEEPYKNPQAPVHIITGSAGCQEFIDVQYFPRPAWNAFGNSQYGYGILEIVNRTNLIFKQKAIVNGVAPGKEKLHVIDQIEIIQENHGPRRSID